MKEEKATVFLDIRDNRHIERRCCALANIGYRIHDLVIARSATRPGSSTAETAAYIGAWLAAHPLEFIAILEQYITEQSGPAALPEWLRQRAKDDSNG